MFLRFRRYGRIFPPGPRSEIPNMQVLVVTEGSEFSESLSTMAA
jgi:hypothetical protein